MRLVVCVAAALFGSEIVSGFVLNPKRTVTSTSRTSPIDLSALGPEHVDPSLLSDNVLQQWHILLADAATTADAATKNTGWWTNYLNIFKNTLQAVHSTVDQPLRSVGITQTWGVSIAIFTAGIRSLLIPLSVQQTKSAEYGKALKPYIAEIKEKFKDNKDAQTRAIGKLYEDAKQNPLSGCLFSILQLPVLLGLYRGIRLLAREGKIDEPFLWIPSLQGPVKPPLFRDMDWLMTGWTPSPDGGLPTPSLGWETTLAFLIMPVLLVIGQSITMNVLAPPIDTSDMTDDERDQTEKTQGFLKFLPLMIGYFSLQVPAGLTIYWFTSNIFSLSQSLVVRAYYAANPPEIELPEYWDALDNIEEMTADEKRKAAAAGIATGPTFADLLAEANFHYVVPRKELRPDSPTWKRLEASGGAIPPELEEWVKAGGFDLTVPKVELEAPPGVAEEAVAEEAKTTV